MRTKEYMEARKEFINCIVLSPICLFVPLIIAFTEWLPIMHAEKSKAAVRTRPDKNGCTDGTYSK